MAQVRNSGQVAGVISLAQLTGPGGQALFSSELTGPFPFGEPTEQALDVELVLDPGVYSILARAVAVDGIESPSRSSSASRP